MVKRIQVPADGSEVSDHAAEEAIRLAGAGGTGLGALSMRPDQVIVATSSERHCGLIFMGATAPVMVLWPRSAGERAQAFARPCPACPMHEHSR